MTEAMPYFIYTVKCEKLKPVEYLCYFFLRREDKQESLNVQWSKE